MIILEGYDDAILGPAYIQGEEDIVQVLVYDAEKIRKILMQRDSMTAEEAREFIEFNIEGAYFGDDSPILVWPDDYYDFRH